MNRYDYMTAKPYFMTTMRLGFRRWKKDDELLAVTLWADPAVTQFIDVRGQLTEAQAVERLHKELTLDKDHGVQYWPLFLLDSDGLIGCSGLRPYDLSHAVYEVGFHILSTHWRQGYAYEAAQAVIDYAFNALKAQRLFAGHNPLNINSRQLLEKLGFQYTHDEFYPPTGLYHPSYTLLP